MTSTSQPASLELKTLRELIDFARLRVLEIGAGDGRLTWPLAGKAKRWVALDPDADELDAAAQALRRSAGRVRERVRLSLGDARQLSFPDGYFDLVFFSYSLC